MRDDHGGGEDVREFRLEGLTLAVAAAVLVLLLTGAFLLGRWVERRNGPAAVPGIAGTEDPLGNVASSEPTADVDASSDFFDKVEEGGAKEMEPGREVRRGLGRDADLDAGTQAQAAVAGGEGIYFVQVWAGRDRQAAELLVEKLQKEGFGVRIVSDRVEGDTLYKVRVGGYETEPEAREMSAKLESSGYRGAWVTTVR